MSDGGKFRPLALFAASAENSNDTYTTIETDVVPGLSQVRLYEETVAHAAEHQEVAAELPAIIRAVGGAIATPTHVEKSYGDSYVFVDTRTTDYDGNPLRVPVKHLVGTGSGRVKTYFFGRVEDDVEVVYRESENDDN